MSQGFGPYHNQPQHSGPAPGAEQPHNADPYPGYGQPPSASPSQPGDAPTWQPAASPAQPGPFAPPPSAPGGHGGPGGPGYPGSQGSPGYPGGQGGSPVVTDGTRKLGTAQLILVIAVLVVRLITFLISFGAGIAGGFAAGSDPDLGLAVLGLGGIISLLLLLANGAVSLALFVVAIITAIKTAGRGRIGAIIIAVAVPVGAVIGFAISLVFNVASTDVDVSTAGVLALVSAGVEIVRGLVIAAALVVGALMTRRWIASA